MTTYLGIDLSSYQTKKTAIVEMTIEDTEARFEILSHHPFNSYDPFKMTIAEQIEEEIAFLNYHYQKRLSRIVVDAPVDLSQIPLENLTDDYSIIGAGGIVQKSYLRDPFGEAWRLRMRPIDRVLNGLPPVFSRLGSVTQRSRLALARAEACETYPRISRKLLGHVEQSSNYLDSFKMFLESHDVVLNAETATITDGEFDAIWCALVGIEASDIATDHVQAMSNPIYAKLAANYDSVPWPKGYRLLVQWPHFIQRVTIARGSKNGR